MQIKLTAPSVVSFLFLFNYTDMKKINFKDIEWQNYLFMVVGCAFYALSTAMFLSPMGIVAGGVSGFAVLMNKATNGLVTVGTVILAVNIPILLMGLKMQGLKFIVRCLLTVACLSLLTDVFTAIIDPITDNPLLASMYAGIAQGVGIGCFIRYKVSSGGTELLGRVIQKFLPFTTIAVWVAILDAVVVLSGALVLDNLENILYALIVIFLSAKVSDIIVVGIDRAKLCYIITDKAEEVSQTLIEQSPRGVTLIEGKGMYTHVNHGVLMTCIKTKQLPQLKEIVKAVDENAFVIISEASEVHGKGFKGISE